MIGFQAGFMSFRDGAVSVVAPIIACEGGVAALFSLAGGEHVNRLVLVGLPLAVAGVVLVSRGEGESSRAGVLPADRRRRSSGVACSRSRRRSPTTSAPAGRSCSCAAARSSSMLPVALALGAPRAARVEWWRVAIWGVCDAGAYFAFVLAADHGPTSVAGVLAAQFGTVGAIVAVVFFGEHLRRRQVVGIAIVALAVGVMAVGSA